MAIEGNKEKRALEDKILIYGHSISPTLEGFDFIIKFEDNKVIDIKPTKDTEKIFDDFLKESPKEKTAWVNLVKARAEVVITYGDKIVVPEDMVKKYKTEKFAVVRK